MLVPLLISILRELLYKLLVICLNSALTEQSTRIDGKAVLQFYSVTNGYRAIVSCIGVGQIEFNFGTSGSIANRLYVSAKDRDGNTVFNRYIATDG